MKKAARRTPRHKVNKRQKALAIRTLEKAITNPATPAHAAVTAARTLLNDGREVDADPIERDPDAPRRFVILPDNGRDPNVRYGQRVVIVPPGWPMEVQPEAHYAGVAKPADIRFGRARPAELLAITAPYEGEAA